MKTFFLFYRDGLPFLREKNPLAGTRLISEHAFLEHEKLYTEAALLLANPIHDRLTYYESELRCIWRYRGEEINGEPAFIDSDISDYDQVFQVISEAPSQQERVRNWLFECFGEKVARNKAERAFRFMEEALELVQAIGLTKEDVHRCVSYTFNRSVGEINQEIGAVGFTLAALCFASGISMQEAVEEEIVRNWGRKDEVIEKWKSKVTVNPIDDGI